MSRPCTNLVSGSLQLLIPSFSSAFARNVAFIHRFLCHARAGLEFPVALFACFHAFVSALVALVILLVVPNNADAFHRIQVRKQI
jgi:hypothetical protein